MARLNTARAGRSGGAAPAQKGRGRSLGSALWWFGMTTLKHMAYAILFSITAVAVAQYAIRVLNGAGG
jgi:hypothetical protein